MATLQHIATLRHACLAAALAAAGCSSMQSTPVAPEAAGIYALVSVDGATVPARVTHGGAALEVRSGTFTLGADGSCSTTTVFVPPSGSELSRTVQARYSANGATLTMHWKGAGTTVGTIEGGTFTMDNEGMRFVYRR